MLCIDDFSPALFFRNIKGLEICIVILVVIFGNNTLQEKQLSMLSHK